MEKMNERIDEELLVTERIEICDGTNFSECLKVSTSMIIGDRERQEDYLNYIIKGQEGLFVVCDGIGGMEHGEIASKEAANSLIYAFYKDTPVQDISLFFQKQILVLDRKIVNIGNEKGLAKGCGTTIAAVHIRENNLSWMSVGDSKIYICRHQKVYPLTREHNYKLLLDQYLCEGNISKSEYELGLKKGQALISYLGLGQVRIADISPTSFPLQDQDWIVLCTDGISKVFTQEQIANLLEISKDTPETSAALLTQTAAQYGNGKNDNCSVIIINYARSKENENCKM